MPVRIHEYDMKTEVTTQGQLKQLFRYGVQGNSEEKVRLPKPYNRLEKGVLEDHVEKDIEATLDFIGAYYFRVQAEGVVRNGVRCPSKMKGQPDYVACIGGMFWGIEAKRPGGNATALQLEKLRSMAIAGGRGIIVATVGGMLEALESDGLRDERWYSKHDWRWSVPVF